MGPVYLNPTFTLTNFGVDTNVFNDPDQQAPKSDWTATFTPGTNLWLRLGRSRLAANVTEDLVYYQKYASERSANTSYKANWAIPFNRLAVTGGASFLNTRERPGFEIDARSERRELAFNGGVEIRALSKTFVGVRGERRRIDFDKAAIFLGSSLHDELTRTMTTGSLTVSHHLTPLTTVTADVSREQDRFRFSPLRDSDSTSASATVAFDPFALIKGSAKIGYRDFAPLAAGLPGYKGSIVAVDLSYVALGATRVGVQVTRDVQYSFDVNQPYYLQTGATASVQQHIFAAIDATGRIGVQRLAYVTRAQAVAAIPDRTDHVRSFGGGLAYRLGRDLRLVFNVDRQRRDSALAYRPYDGLKFGASVMYGS